MARKCKRTRPSRASIETLRAEFQAKRNNPAAFALLLQRLAESDYPLWSVARCAAGDKPLDDDERAMLAELAAPHLACKSRGSVFLQYMLAKKHRWQQSQAQSRRAAI